MKTKISFFSLFFALSFVLFLFSSFEKSNENIDAKVLPGIDVMAFPCLNGGETLVVYNPNDADLNFFNSDEYQVIWVSEDGVLAGTRTRLQCVCKGRYSVIVLNKLTHTGVGRAFYTSLANCNSDNTGVLSF